MQEELVELRAFRWIVNRLTITGPSEQLAAYRDKARAPVFPQYSDKRNERAGNTVLNYHAILPVPAEVQAYGYEPRISTGLVAEIECGLGWQEAYWNVRQNNDEHAVCAESVDANGALTALCYVFDSIERPPQHFVIYGSKAWPDLRFVLDYFDSDKGWEGTLICKQGGVEHAESQPIDETTTT